MKRARAFNHMFTELERYLLEREFSKTIVNEWDLLLQATSMDAKEILKTAILHRIKLEIECP